MTYVIRDPGPDPIWECEADSELDALTFFIQEHPRLTAIYLGSGTMIRAEIKDA
jgi:hypothetical protein